jgi:hypothetical protein
MKISTTLLLLAFLYARGMLLAAEPAASVGTLPPTLFALAETPKDGKEGTITFYNLPRSPVSPVAIFTSKAAAETFGSKLIETPAGKLTPFPLQRSDVGSFLKLGSAAILLDPASATEGGTPVVDAAPSGGEAGGNEKIQRPAPSVLNPNLREEILARGKRDQEIRLEVIRQGNEHAPADVLERMIAIDKDNREWLKAIVHQHGWPGPESVGNQATEIAWLLVQHADLEFQKECLPQIRDAYMAGALSGGNFALLQDRILVGEGKPQIYGSQAMPVNQWKNGQPTFRPIEDEANVDKRRAGVGLGPLADYTAALKAMYLPHSDTGSTGTGGRVGLESPSGEAGLPAASAREAK